MNLYDRILRVNLMKIFVQNKKELNIACHALILPIFENEGLKIYTDIDKALKGLVKKIISSREFTGKHNEISLIHTQGMIRSDRLLLIGLGERKHITRERFRQAGGKACSYLGNLKVKNTFLSIRAISSLKNAVIDFAEGCMLADYRFEKYIKKNTGVLKKLTILSSQDIKKKMAIEEAVVSATHLARDLVNTPANDMTPSILARHARSLKNISLTVINRKQAEKLGMGAYLSVARGSSEPPKFIVIRYKKKNTAPLVIIGKSITFDSGGLSLKPGQGMEKMKYDMAGGAATLGVMKAVTELNLPLHITGILPATENLPGGSASKPGDVVKTIDGKTIEIITTDAEGRLVLADALGFARRLKPSAIIDIATLTGACPIALGNEAVAMMGNDDLLMKKMRAASDATGERVWQMPLFDEYREYIKSDIADLKNSSGKIGSLVTAGYFLKEFSGEIPWIHLDIAGTAWIEKERSYTPQGATGVGVRLLMEFVKNCVDNRTM